MENNFNQSVRVMHIYRDKAGNIHSREGWMLNKSAETKSTITIAYADNGKHVEVPARELQILGVAVNSRILVRYIAMVDGQEVIKRGFIVEGGKENKISVLFDGEADPVLLPANEISLIGQVC